MNHQEIYSAVIIDEQMIESAEFAAICGVSAEWIALHVQAGVLPASGENPAAWRFSGSEIRRVHRLLALERDFDALPELAALVLDLQDEIARLRANQRKIATL